jgi:hypothetical protein
LRYDYYCTNGLCLHTDEILRSMKEPFLIECPECHQPTFKVAINRPEFIIPHDPKTVGLLADRNTKAMSIMERCDRQSKQDEDRKKAQKICDDELASKLPKGASLIKRDENAPSVDTSLANLSPVQQERFIETGKK